MGQASRDARLAVILVLYHASDVLHACVDRARVIVKARPRRARTGTAATHVVLRTLLPVVARLPVVNAQRNARARGHVAGTDAAGRV